MAVGKNKKLGKKKRAGKKIVDPFSKKEWYDVVAPNNFGIRAVGKTPVNKTVGTKVARDSLIGRVFTVSLGDLQKQGEDEAFRQFKLKCEEVQGNSCLTSFYGMRLTTDKMRSLVRKWQTLIEAYADVKTTDGYHIRIFVIGFTKRRPNQNRKTSYAQHAQVKRIRKRMVDVIQKEVGNVELSELVNKLLAEAIGKEIEKVCQAIYPLQNVLVYKVKTMRSPKLDIGKLMEQHGGAITTAAPAAAAAAAAAPAADAGKPVDRPAAAAPAAAKSK